MPRQAPPGWQVIVARNDSAPERAAAEVTGAVTATPARFRNDASRGCEEVESSSKVYCSPTTTHDVVLLHPIAPSQESGEVVAIAVRVQMPPMVVAAIAVDVTHDPRVPVSVQVSSTQSTSDGTAYISDRDAISGIGSRLVQEPADPLVSDSERTRSAASVYVVRARQ